MSDPKNFPEPALTESRRGLLGRAAGVVLGGAAVAALLRPGTALASSLTMQTLGWYNVKGDFNAIGDGSHDDTTAFQTAIYTAAGNQTPLFVPQGNYLIKSTLIIPSNTVIFGSNLGLGFDCAIVTNNCAAFTIVGTSTNPVFACSIENLMIKPVSSSDTPSYYIALGNSYSICLRNIRIYNVVPTSAAVLLRGSPSGALPSNNIIWDNLIVRNDGSQGSNAVLAQPGCGTHAFINPDLENFGTLFEWQGGQINLYSPYTERVGRYGLNCNATADTTAYLNTYGGQFYSNPSGNSCAVQSGSQGFSSFGTNWLNPSGDAIAFYGIPISPVAFHGMSNPNLSGGPIVTGPGNVFWQLSVRFPELLLRNYAVWSVVIPSGQQNVANITVTGAQVGTFWARATLNASLNGLALSAYVSAGNTVTVVAQNNTGSTVSASGTLFVECGWL